MSKVALIDAGGANLGSVRYALERENATVAIVRDADGLRGAKRVVLPGVGAAPAAMALLRERGLVEGLRTLQVPLLGICLGMQLLFDASEEGNVACLGMLSGAVRKLEPSAGVRVPHMGWSTLQPVRDDPLLRGVDGSAYFVHGYGVPVTADCVASYSHGRTFAAVVRRGLVMGAQFHPERSGAAGARLLRNFLALVPA